jgi:hypothetical protein
MDFGAPSGGGYFKPAAHKGNLILVTKLYDIDKHYDTFKQAEVDRARVDVHDLTLGETYAGAYMTHVGLVNSVRDMRPSRPILAYVGQVDTGKGNPAWTLIRAKDGDADKAREFLTKNPDYAPAATGAAGSDEPPF